MRIDVRLAAVVAGILMAVMTAAPVRAQSLLQTLFGQSPPKPVEALPPPMPSYRAPVHVPRSRPSQDEDEEVLRTSRLGGAKVRTVCVRMCDGYYFPISSQTRQSRLTPDSLHCKAACGHEARLFYSTDGGGDPASMVDLTGRRYDAIQNAFAYRKKLTPGCACKPVPWSAEERMRHTRYAIERAQAVAKLREAQAVKLAAAQGDSVEKGAPPAAKDQTSSTASRSADDAQTPTAAQSLAELQPAIGVPGQTTQPASTAPNAIDEQFVDRKERRYKAERATRRTTMRSEPHIAAVRPLAAANKSARQATAAPASGGLFNFGKSKYVWPGDPR